MNRSSSTSLTLGQAIAGCLLGTAVADALGLPAEGLSKRRGKKPFPDLDHFHFLFGKGFCSDDTEHACMTAQARLTHTDPRAEMGAYAVAVAGHLAARSDDSRQLRLLERLKLDLGGDGAELIALLEQAAASAAESQSPEDFAAAIGCGTGVSGYTLHTVQVAIQAWMRHPTDFRSAIQGVIRCGGDTDTAAAITGALVGIRVGQEGIPAAWLGDLAEWPRTTAWMRALAERLALALEGDANAPPLALNLPALALRNLLFLVVVLAHGFRRLLPPY